MFLFLTQLHTTRTQCFLCVTAAIVHSNYMRKCSQFIRHVYWMIQIYHRTKIYTSAHEVSIDTQARDKASGLGGRNNCLLSGSVAI